MREEKKKYLLIGDGESPHILKWARALSPYFELYLVSSRKILPEISEYIPEERQFAFNMQLAESGGNFKVLRMLFPLRRIINTVEPDFVNAHYISSYGLVAALCRMFAYRKFPLILSAWGSDILVTPFRNALYKMAVRMSLKQAVLATSDSLRVAGIMKEIAPVETMSFPFGLDELPTASPEEKDPWMFFSNRTLNENSNIDRVMHFFAKVQQEKTEARLIIANDGPKKDELMRLGRELGIENAVEFTGFISTVQQEKYYRKARYYFSLLTSDALSVSLLEALAFGCIPIVSDLSDNREWVDDGVNGIILNQGHRADILDAVGRNAGQIFEINRKKISEGAIFPRSIAEYVSRIMNSEHGTWNNIRYRMPDARCRMPDAGYRMPDARNQ